MRDKNTEKFIKIIKQAYGRALANMNGKDKGAVYKLPEDIKEAHYYYQAVSQAFSDKKNVRVAFNNPHLADMGNHLTIHILAKGI